ncbi:hypothetical protein [Nitratireductor luteus]|uniref:hypothetical protein n=1 Tax=Nitratireductor luteus TaxID=2976980 RepID=UPI0022405D61|nr:hypothetical protein [Nitratireductor luteus]
MSEGSYSDDLYRDADGTLKRIKQEAVQEAVQQVTQAYTQHQGQQQFWSGFYTQHSDINPQDHDITQAVLSSNIKDLADLPVAEASEKLAGLVRERIERLGGGDPNRKLTPDEMDERVMRGGLEHGTPYREAPPARGQSLGDVVRQRKEARYEASKTLRGRARAE